MTYLGKTFQIKKNGHTTKIEVKRKNQDHNIKSNPLTLFQSFLKQNCYCSNLCYNMKNMSLKLYATIMWPFALANYILCTYNCENSSFFQNDHTSNFNIGIPKKCKKRKRKKRKEEEDICRRKRNSQIVQEE